MPPPRLAVHRVPGASGLCSGASGRSQLTLVINAATSRKVHNRRPRAWHRERRSPRPTRTGQLHLVPGPLTRLMHPEIIIGPTALTSVTRARKARLAVCTSHARTSRMKLAMSAPESTVQNAMLLSCKPSGTQIVTLHCGHSTKVPPAAQAVLSCPAAQCSTRIRFRLPPFIARLSPREQAHRVAGTRIEMTTLPADTSTPTPHVRLPQAPASAAGCRRVVTVTWGPREMAPCDPVLKHACIASITSR